MALSKPLPTEFGIHHRLESCDGFFFFFVDEVLCRAYAMLALSYGLFDTGDHKVEKKRSYRPYLKLKR